MRHPLPSCRAASSATALLVVAAVLLSTAALAAAADRPLSADRPDRTESPYTVPPGCFQLETDFVAISRQGDADGLEIGTLNLKAGIHRAVDLQLVSAVHQRAEFELPPWGRVRDDSALPSLGLRLKWNLAGNDSGTSAIGLLSYVEFAFLEDDVPTTTGVVFPFAAALPNAFGFGAMAGVERVEGEGSSLVASATIGRPLADRLGAFVEMFGAWAWDGAPAEVNDATFDWGLTYDLLPTLRLDLGACHGLSAKSEDLRVFAGGSWRLPR